MTTLLRPAIDGSLCLLLAAAPGCLERAYPSSWGEEPVCYATLLSIDSTTDLARYNDALLRFSRPTADDPSCGDLRFPHVWRVDGRSGCSCGLRHLPQSMVELGFGKPNRWFAESEASIVATRRFAAVLRQLTGRGAAVDCMDLALRTTDEPVLQASYREVDLKRLADDEFCFFENHYFSFVSSR